LIFYFLSGIKASTTLEVTDTTALPRRSYRNAWRQLTEQLSEQLTETLK